jgi:hypothetical protein
MQNIFVVPPSIEWASSTRKLTANLSFSVCRGLHRRPIPRLRTPCRSRAERDSRGFLAQRERWTHGRPLTLQTRFWSEIGTGWPGEPSPSLRVTDHIKGGISSRQGRRRLARYDPHKNGPGQTAARLWEPLKEILGFVACPTGLT